MEMKWDSIKMDEEIYKSGKDVIYLTGSSEAVQSFVEHVSDQIGGKLDFRQFAGITPVQTMETHLKKAREYVNTMNQEEIMSRFPGISGVYRRFFTENYLYDGDPVKDCRGTYLVKKLIENSQLIMIEKSPVAREKMNFDIGAIQQELERRLED